VNVLESKYMRSYSSKLIFPASIQLLLSTTSTVVGISALTKKLPKTIHSKGTLKA